MFSIYSVFEKWAGRGAGGTVCFTHHFTLSCYLFIFPFPRLRSEGTATVQTCSVTDKIGSERPIANANSSSHCTVQKLGSSFIHPGSVLPLRILVLNALVQKQPIKSF